jgi:hypothetical protein
VRPLPAAIRASTSSWIVAAPRTPALLWPAGDRRHTNAVSRWLAALTETDGTLACDPGKVEALVSAWPISSADIRRRIGVSRQFTPWFDRLRRKRLRWKRLREEARGIPCGSQGRHCEFRFAAPAAAALSRDGMLHLAR